MSSSSFITHTFLFLSNSLLEMLWAKPTTLHDDFYFRGRRTMSPSKRLIYIAFLWKEKIQEWTLEIGENRAGRNSKDRSQYPWFSDIHRAHPQTPLICDWHWDSFIHWFIQESIDVSSRIHFWVPAMIGQMLCKNLIHLADSCFRCANSKIFVLWPLNGNKP